jgi:hypothetical protein
MKEMKMADAEKKRQDLEKLALVRFKEVASHYSPTVYDGQGANNRVAQLGRSYFQFGDLRVDTPQRHLIVEVESAGGATNLVKYWYCLEERHIVRLIHLFHIFAQASENDYVSHLLLWDSLCAKMSKALGNLFTAKRYTYRSPSELEVAVNEFERTLKKEFSH